MSIFKHLSALLLTLMVVGCGGGSTENKSADAASVEVKEPVYFGGVSRKEARLLMKEEHKAQSWSQ